MSEFIDSIKLGIKNESDQDSNSYYQMTSCAEPFILDYGSFKQTKLPSRKHGEKYLEMDVDYEKEVADILKLIKEMVLKRLNQGTDIPISLLEYLLVSTKPFPMDSLSEIDKEIIKKVFSPSNLKRDFGENSKVIITCDDACKPYLKDLL